MKMSCPGAPCDVAVCCSQVADFVVGLLVWIMRFDGRAAPALTRRPFGVAGRPTLHCGEHGPRRLSALEAHGTNRGHVLALECGAQWSLRCALLVCHRPLLQSVAAAGGA